MKWLGLLSSHTYRNYQTELLQIVAVSTLAAQSSADGSVGRWVAPPITDRQPRKPIDGGRA